MPLRRGCCQTGFSEWVKARWVDRHLGPEPTFPTVLEAGCLSRWDAYHRIYRWRHTAGAWVQVWAPAVVPVQSLAVYCAHRVRALGFRTFHTMARVQELDALRPIGVTLEEPSRILGQRLPRPAGEQRV